MAEGTREILLHFSVAAVAQRGLFFDQQILLLLGMVRRVAGDAGDAVEIVLGTVEIGMFLAILVASQAALADFLGFGVGEAEDFCLISAAFYVGLARAVAALAPMVGRAAHGGRLEGIDLLMAAAVDALEFFFVTAFAGVRPDVLRSVGDRRRFALVRFFGGRHGGKNRQQAEGDR